MSNIVTIKNLNFGYDDNKIFNDFNLNIECGNFISLIGPNGSGKSTLIKILTGLLNYNGEVQIDNLVLNNDNVKTIRKKIGFISNNVENQLFSEKVIDNIAFSLENLNIPYDIILSKIEEVTNYLGIQNVVERNIDSLTNVEKNMVNLASVLVYEPKLLILDEAFSSLDKIERDKILLILKDLNEKKQITIINITQNMEDILFGNQVIILDKGKIISNDNNIEVFKNDKIFSKLGLNLPFMVDLSIKLKYYSLIDEIIYDMEEMVDVLWK